MTSDDGDRDPPAGGSDDGSPADVGGDERTGAGPEDAADDGETPPPGEPETDASAAAVSEEIEDLREEFREFREDVRERTLHRDDVEEDLRQYVRREIRSGHARGWGPYLVLLYGTLMTVGGFYYLENLWAILAMVVIWLSTLGLYVLMVMFGLAVEALGLPGRAIDRIRSR